MSLEIARLSAELADVERRVTEARARVHASTVERAAVQADVVAHRTRLAEQERRHRESLDEIRRTTQAETDRIMTEARSLAATPLTGDVSRPG